MVGKHFPMAAAVLMLSLGASAAPAQMTSLPQQQPYTTSLRGQQSAYTVLYVNPLTGDDLYGTGIQRQPFKTITHALQVAQAGTVIVLAPGRYTVETGEAFPLELKPGVTLQGNPNAGQSVMILGGGTFQSETLSQQNATILMSDRSGLGYVVVSNDQNQGHGVWVESGSPVIRNSAFVANRHTGLYVANGSPSIEGSYFHQNQVAGLVLYGESRAAVRRNHFESTGTAVTVASTAAPEIADNRILHNDEGIVLLGNARPTLANNEISQNRRNGVVEVASARAPSQIVASVDNAPLALIPVSEPVSASVSAAAALPVTSPSRPASTSADDAEAVAPGSPVSISALRARLNNSPVDQSVRSVEAPSADLAGSETSSETSSEGNQVANTNAPIIIFGAGTQPTADATANDPDLIEPAVTPTESNIDLARLPGLPASNSLEAPDVLPVVQAPEQRPTASNESALEAEAEAEAEVEAASSSPVSIAALRNRLTAQASGSESVSGRAPLVSRSQPNSISIEVIPATSSSSVAPSTQVSGRRAQPSLSQPPLSTSNVPAIAATSGQRLPVPRTSIPVGSGGHSIASVRPPTRFDNGSSPPPPPSRAAALGLSYRVLVQASDAATQRRLRALVPDAFRTQYQGQMLMQAGAYADDVTAQERLQLLLDNGLEARVEYLP